MGVSCTSYMIAGVRMSEIFKIEYGVTEQIRYDENTGKPYAAMIKTRRFMLFGKEIPEPAEHSPECWPQLKGLSHANSGFSFWEANEGSSWDRYDYSEAVVGVLLREASEEGNSIGEFNLGEVNSACSKASEALYKLGASIPIKCFLVQRCS